VTREDIAALNWEKRLPHEKGALAAPPVQFKETFQESQTQFGFHTPAHSAKRNLA
jgi:hypothetical protein